MSERKTEYLNITPTSQGLQHMANLFYSQQRDSESKISQANKLLEELSNNYAVVGNAKEYEQYAQHRLIIEALELLVDQEETRIGSMEAGLATLSASGIHPTVKP